MKRCVIVLCALLFMAVSAGSWAATPTPAPWSGTLTVAGGGITATEQWAGNSSMQWKVDVLVGGLYKYDYTFTVPEKDISHMLVETSTNIGCIGYKADEWGDEGNSTPGIPGLLFGVKIPSMPTGSTSTAWTFSFTTTHAPVWGDFYAKDGTSGGPGGGNDVYAYNSGFDGLTFDPDDYIWNTEVGTGHYRDKIAVPDHVSSVPEASTLLGFGSALVMVGPGMIGWLRRHRA